MSKKHDKQSETNVASNVVEERNVVDTKVADTKAPDVTTDTPAKRATLVDAVFDFGIHWATAGLKLAKVALEETSKALASTAKTLENLAESLSPKKQA